MINEAKEFAVNELFLMTNFIYIPIIWYYKRSFLKERKLYKNTCLMKSDEMLETFELNIYFFKHT